MSLGINDGTFRRDGYFTTSLRYADREKLIRFGLVAGFGDAFEYEGRGVVVVGHSGLGKTALVRQFAENRGCHVLAEDELLLYDRRNTGELRVVPYPYLEAKSWSETVARYAEFLSENDEPPLWVIVHLNGEDVFERDGFVQEDMYRALGFFYTLPRINHPDIKGFLQRELAHVTCLEYAKNHGFSDDEHLRDTFGRVNATLLNLLERENNSGALQLIV